jgi:hypothetical protein
MCAALYLMLHERRSAGASETPANGLHSYHLQCTICQQRSVTVGEDTNLRKLARVAALHTGGTRVG